MFAVKPTVVRPAGTLTWLGAMALELLLEIVMDVPPTGAAPAKETVQLVLPAPVRVLGAQTSEETFGCAATGAASVSE